MRAEASVLHLDMDAFFAAVEQRDKPSLRGKQVVVGGLGGRGVVSTASYEARRLGVGSAMAMSEARRRAPHAAYLSGRFGAYQQSSRVVMELLKELSPKVEALSLDEAFVDLRAGGVDCSDREAVRQLIAGLRAEVARRTAGLTASVGVGSSKFMAKLASEMAKPDGVHIVQPGTEAALIAPLSVRAVPGVGPATGSRLEALGIHTVAQLQSASLGELTRELGVSSGESLHRLAHARDDRPVASEREAKSISVEDTFAEDQHDREVLERILRRDSAVVAARLQAGHGFARTVTLKVRQADFTTSTRSRTLAGAFDSAERVAQVASELLGAVPLRQGVRLIGVGVSNFVSSAQEELFDIRSDGIDEVEETPGPQRRRSPGWSPGVEVLHSEHGRGWVWGSGLGRVTVRFETRLTGVGPVRDLRVDDPQLDLAVDLLPLPGDASADGAIS